MKKTIGLILVSFLLQNCNRMTKIDKLLNLEDETETVIQIGELLWEKSKNDNDFESLNEYEKNVLFIEMLEGQVNNGGFDQYFFNSSGEYAHETLKALEEIKAYQMAEILNNAIKAFPTLPIPKDTEQRRELMEDISENISETWDKLDDKFYEYPENLAGLVIEYVKVNKREFE